MGLHKHLPMTTVNGPTGMPDTPGIEDPATLPNNRKAVEHTLLRNERQLVKELEWKAADAAQVNDMVNRPVRDEVVQISFTCLVWTSLVY